ncbi:uncharacterized protein VNE69_02265 [Vairimorpha necatrix]|uniref:Uncharacterized protein n=1 Tax=Vairimorpha necatrix TaxID=6039 RepID=A0AAX4JA05_9MICR
MICLKFFSLFFLTQASQFIYNIIGEIVLEKIEKREFEIFNLKKNYCKMFIKFSFDTDCLTQQIYDKSVKNNGNEKIRLSLATNTDDEINKIFKKSIFSNGYKGHKKMILVYNKDESNRMIEIIKKINSERAKQSKPNVFCFENIIEKEYLEENYKSETYLSREEAESKHYKKVFDIKKDNEFFLRLTIRRKAVLYYFDINVKEITNKYLQKLNQSDNNITKIISDNGLNENILDMIYEEKLVYNTMIVLIAFLQVSYDDESVSNILYLYKLTEVTNIKACNMSKLIFCTLDHVECKSINFSATINKNEIIFQNQNVYDIRDSKEFADDFKKICKIFYEINLTDFEEIEMFYQLLKTNNKVEMLVDKLFTKKGYALNIFFIHLCESFGIKQKNRNTKTIMKIFETNCIEFDYMMKILIFIKAEELINENKELNDPILKQLKDIGNIFNKKCRSNLFFKNNENLYINLLKIFGRIISFKADIKRFNKFIWTGIIKTMSLFERLNNDSNKYNEVFRIIKDEIMINLGYDSKKIREINEELMTALESKIH